MATKALAADPYNLIITGVGGQGNVLASKLVGNMLAEDKSLATLPVTCYILGTALSTLPVNLMMRRLGRRAVPVEDGGASRSRPRTEAGGRPAYATARSGADRETEFDVAEGDASRDHPSGDHRHSRGPRLDPLVDSELSEQSDGQFALLALRLRRSGGRQ